MQDFTIVTDSFCDLPMQLKTDKKLEIVPSYVSFDKETYLKENIDIDIKTFYKKITTEDIFPTTSLPSIADYLNIFKNILEKDLDILYISASSKFSGVYQTAFNAAKILLEEFPKRNIMIIDSKKATVAQGLYTLEAVKMKEAGFSLKQTFDKMQEIIDQNLVIFTVDTLKYLEKGGRIGKAKTLASSLFNIKPIIALENGALEPIAKVKGRKNSLLKLLDLFINKIDTNNIDNYEIAIANANCKEDAIELEKLLKQMYHINLTYPIFDIGICVTAHTGPTAVGIGFIKKYDK